MVPHKISINQNQNIRELFTEGPRFAHKQLVHYHTTVTRSVSSESISQILLDVYLGNLSTYEYIRHRYHKGRVDGIKVSFRCLMAVDYWFLGIISSRLMYVKYTTHEVGDTSPSVVSLQDHSKAVEHYLPSRSVSIKVKNGKPNFRVKLAFL